MADALLASGASIGAVIAHGREVLTAAGCDAPRLDSELLLAESLGVGRERLVLDRDRPLERGARERFGALLERRAAREPVAYILGRREFRRITLEIDRRVLIPRPETELLVEVGLELPAGVLVTDVGTGSGAVALALKDERPDLAVRGTDVDSGALTVARRNAVRLGLEVEFSRADLLGDGGAGGRGGAIGGAVLANLPYVPDGSSLAPEISLYEPAGALFAGSDGLSLVRRLVFAACAAAQPGIALLALEIGSEQAGAVVRLMGQAGYTAVEVRRDLAGYERVVVGRR